MALFKIHKGLSENLMKNVPNAKDGFAYFTTDDGKFYIDIAGDGTSSSRAVVNVNRIPLNAVKSDIASTIEATEMSTSDSKVYPILAFNITDSSKNLVEAKYGQIGIKNGTLVIPDIAGKDEVLITNTSDGRAIVIENKSSNNAIEITEGKGIKVAQDPIDDLELATKQYVDNQNVVLKLKISDNSIYWENQTSYNFTLDAKSQTAYSKLEGAIKKGYTPTVIIYDVDNTFVYKYSFTQTLIFTNILVFTAEVLLSEDGKHMGRDFIGFQSTTNGTTLTIQRLNKPLEYVPGDGVKNQILVADSNGRAKWTNSLVTGDFLHTTGKVNESADGNKTFTGKTLFEDNITIHSADDTTTALVIKTFEQTSNQSLNDNEIATYTEGGVPIHVADISAESQSNLTSMSGGDGNFALSLNYSSGAPIVLGGHLLGNSGNFQFLGMTSGSVNDDPEDFTDIVNLGYLNTQLNKIGSGFLTFKFPTDANDPARLILEQETSANQNEIILKATHNKAGPNKDYTSGNTVTEGGGEYDGSFDILIPQITVNQYGHVTKASDQKITIKTPPTPDIGNASLTIRVGSEASEITTGTGTFTANQKEDSTIELPVYTINEINTKLGDKAPLNHTHVKADITDFKHTHNTLTLKAGNTSKTYNGGTDITFEVKASDLGLNQALRFIGFATVDIEDGSDTNPVITGYDWSKKQTGDVVISKDSTYEYVWTSNGVWERLGPDTSGTGEKYTFTAASGQTAFTLPGTFADPSLLTVFYNGVLMTEVDNYTITNGTLNLVGFAANDNDKIIVLGLTDISSSSNLQGDVSDLKNRASRALYNNITNIMTNAGKIQMASTYTPTSNVDVVTKGFTDKTYSKTNHNHAGVYIENNDGNVGGFISQEVGGNLSYYWGCNDPKGTTTPVSYDDMEVGTAGYAKSIFVQTYNGTTKEYLPTCITADGRAVLHTKTALYTENNVIFGAAWNDYAEYRCGNVTEGGYCVVEKGDDTLVLSSARMIPGANLTSDTFGFAIGKSETCQTPVAVSGRVLVYPYEPIEEFKKNIGRPVCSGPNGTVSIMSDEEYKEKGYCAIGTISAVPAYETWGSANVKVNGRVWIKVF